MLASLRLRTALFVVVTPGLAACSLLVSTSGLAGGPGDASVPEAGAEGSPSDGGDGAAREDAVADGGLPLPFCASLVPAPVYCADFDDGRPVTALGDVSGSPPPSIDSTHALSGKASMRLDLSETPDGGFHIVTVTASLGSALFTTYEVAMAVRLDAVTIAKYTELASFELAQGTERYTLLLRVYGGNVQLIEEHGPNGNENEVVVVTTAMPTTEWVTVRYAGAFGAGSPLTFFVNDKQIASTSLPASPSAAASSGQLVYGARFSGPGQPAKVFHVDNVVVDVK